MIRISGTATLRVPFYISLDITGEQYDALSDRKIDQLIEESVDWQDAGRNAEITGIDVDDVEGA